MMLQLVYGKGPCFLIHHATAYEEANDMFPSGKLPLGCNVDLKQELDFAAGF